MKKTSSVRIVLRTLSLIAITAAALSLWEGRAWADSVCGGGYEPPRDAGTGRDAGDGSTLGTLRGPAGTRRKAGAGLVLVAGLGGAWLVSRRKDGDANGDGRGGAQLK